MTIFLYALLLFVVREGGGTIKTIGLRKYPIFYETSEEYVPCDTNSFLRALDEVLGSQGWFLGYITSSDNTLVLKHERIRGNLYSHKCSSKDSGE